MGILVIAELHSIYWVISVDQIQEYLKVTSMDQAFYFYWMHDDAE